MKIYLGQLFVVVFLFLLSVPLAIKMACISQISILFLNTNFVTTARPNPLVCVHVINMDM